MKRSIWFDMTTSMQWTGGVVGIIRAELEVAKNISKINDDIKFCMEKDGGFIEIKKKDIPWLWESNNVADAYIANRKVETKKNVNAEVNNAISLKNNIKTAGDGKLNRLKNAFYFFISTMPKPLQGISLILLYLPLKFTALLSYVYSRLKIFGNSKGATLIQHAPQHPSSPFNKNDVFISMGWMDSNKEEVLKRLKREINFNLVYLIYDLILINKQTSHLYHKIGSEKFKKYFRWASNNCDFLLFGGETAKIDALRFQDENGYKSPLGASVKFGSDIVGNLKVSKEEDEIILKRLGVERDFIITVGSIEGRKNHDVIYKAFSIMGAGNVENIPLLVIIGKPSYRSEELVDNIARDPTVNNNIVCMSPSDIELDCLYRNCIFTLLPSLYEGWSLTLPESLGYGKFCLCSDVQPLREIGEGLVDFLDKHDPFVWAKKIEYYSSNKNELVLKEKNIATSWTNTTWNDCAKKINELCADDHFLENNSKKDSFWFDLTTSYAVWRGGVSGIIRTELVLAKELYKTGVDVIFFAYASGEIFIIEDEQLEIIFDADTIDEGYSNFQQHWNQLESRGLGNRIPTNLVKRSDSPIIYPELQDAYNYSLSRKSRLLHSIILFGSLLPMSLGNKCISYLYRLKRKLIKNDNVNVGDVILSPVKIDTNSNAVVPFNKNDIVLSVGIDWSTELLTLIKKTKNQVGYTFCQLIYDLTPVITPHLHSEYNQKAYHRFLKVVSEVSDDILYGGATAMRDGLKYQAENNWRSPPSYFVRFGSDISSTQVKDIDVDSDSDILRRLKISGDFIITVGTIEIRKNHESLYKAYLKLIEDGLCPPKLIIVGRVGWKISGFIESFDNDERIKKYIVRLSPSDKELDVLYRNCLFTVLPSMYEGWSLTLPESLSYGKFCLTSDVEPLREVGKDLVEYIHPWDINKWAERIMYYYENRDDLDAVEQKIKSNWTKITWNEFAKDIVTKLKFMNKTEE